MSHQMMTCGCQAQGTVNGEEGCVIHGVTTPMAAPDLTGRIARCSYCKSERPSADRERLAFFEYRGPGSNSARICECGYAEIAHTQEVTESQRNVVSDGRCPGYRPRGDVGTDTFYDGCKGWD